MRTHQRYFAMEHPGGKLANRFVTLMATVVKDPAVVQRGNERQIASRLADAKFFFAEDRRKSFEQWNEKLAPVVFQAKLVCTRSIARSEYAFWRRKTVEIPFAIASGVGSTMTAASASCSLWAIEQKTDTTQGIPYASASTIERL